MLRPAPADCESSDGMPSSWLIVSSVQLCCAQSALHEWTFLPAGCTLFYRSELAFQRLVAESKGATAADSSPGMLRPQMHAYLDLLSTASELLAIQKAPHELVTPLPEGRAGDSRNVPVVLPHLCCTVDVPGELSAQLHPLMNSDFLPCKPSVPLRGAPSGAKPRIVVVPGCCLVTEDSPDGSGTPVDTTRLTGSFKLELLRLMCAHPETVVLPVSGELFHGPGA